MSVARVYTTKKSQCEACQEKREEWLEECRDAAREVVDSVEQL